MLDRHLIDQLGAWSFRQDVGMDLFCHIERIERCEVLKWSNHGCGCQPGNPVSRARGGHDGSLDLAAHSQG